jgi:hypothetical protein
VAAKETRDPYDAHPERHLVAWVRRNWPMIIVLVGVGWNIITLHFRSDADHHRLNAIMERIGPTAMERWIASRVQMKDDIKYLRRDVDELRKNKYRSP